MRDEDEAALSAMIDLAEEAYAQPRSISGVALRLRDDRWEEFLPERGHPAYAPFRMLYLRSIASDYDNQKAILDEAVSRDIPWLRLNEHSLVQLGQGVHQRRIRATMTSNTSALAVDIAGDKELTTRLLASAGLPVPRSEAVRTAEQAVRAGNRIGYPVVCKPLDGNHGRGVVLNIRNADELRAAFPVAEDESRRGTVVVESFITGKDYRVLIIGDGQIGMLAAACAAASGGIVTATWLGIPCQAVEADSTPPRLPIPAPP